MESIKVRFRLSGNRSYTIQDRSSTGGLNRAHIGGSEPKLYTYFKTGSPTKIERRYTWKDGIQKPPIGSHRPRTCRHSEAYTVCKLTVSQPETSLNHNYSAHFFCKSN
ncbi:hypothetical protein ACF0H5_022194 [Mactra antiquata]